eukprot:g56617.t1
MSESVNVPVEQFSVLHRPRKARWQPSRTTPDNGRLVATGSWGAKNGHIFLQTYHPEGNAHMSEGQKLSRAMASVPTQEKYRIFSSFGRIFFYQQKTVPADSGRPASLQLQLQPVRTWEKVHTGPGTALALHGDEIASIGEDGQLCLLNVRGGIRHTLRSSTALYCAKFPSSHQLPSTVPNSLLIINCLVLCQIPFCTLPRYGGVGGVTHWWDLRSPSSSSKAAG